MSDYESNCEDIGCPFCDANPHDCSDFKNNIEFCLDDEEWEFYQCPKCDKFFKVELQIFKQYDYIVSKPSEEEIEKNNLLSNKDPNIFEDVPGQIFIWKDLFTNES